MNMRGPSAEVRYGYQVAARLGAWELTPKAAADSDVLAFTGAVREVDEYWIAQDPLELTLRVGRTLWVWEGMTLAFADGQRTLYADLKGKPRITPA